MIGSNKYEAAQLFPTLTINLNIRMISKGSCDTEDCSNDWWKISALHHKKYTYILKYSKIENFLFFNISHYFF